jgi:dolichyl-phosphate-mannose--protein O-mannosyl transferase
LAAWWGEQGDILRFHRNLVARHPDRSSAWGWPMLDRPVLYHFERCDSEERARPEGCAVAGDQRAKILGLGNPAVWWPALAAYPVLAYAALRRRDWRAAALLLFLLAQWLPWVVQPTPGYFFYMTPVVAFMCLSLAFLAERCAQVRQLRWVPAGLAVLAVATFAFFYPVYAAVEAPREVLDRRIWTEEWR